MSKSKTALSTITSVAGVLISLVGFIFVGYQISDARQEFTASTNDRLLQHDSEIMLVLMQYPETRPFIYDNKRLTEITNTDQQAEKLRSRVLVLVELYANLFLNVALQYEYMSPDVQETWATYTQNMYQRSYELRRSLSENSQWYPERMKKMAGYNSRWPEEI